jgi:hypothetical protein
MAEDPNKVRYPHHLRGGVFLKARDKKVMDEKSGLGLVAPDSISTT